MAARRFTVFNVSPMSVHWKAIEDITYPGRLRDDLQRFGRAPFRFARPLSPLTCQHPSLTGPGTSASRLDGRPKTRTQQGNGRSVDAAASSGWTAGGVRISVCRGAGSLEVGMVCAAGWQRFEEP